MIREVTDTLKSRLEEYLSSIYELPDGHVVLGGIPAGGEDTPNKITLSIVNIERETAMGNSQNYRTVGSNDMVEQLPPWYLNLYVLIAAVYDEKRYAEGLRMLSLAIAYLQSHIVFPLTKGKRFSLEMLTITIEEESNIWSMLGGRYYPSIVCKIRMLTFESDNIQSTVKKVTKPDVR